MVSSPSQLQTGQAQPSAGLGTASHSGSSGPFAQEGHCPGGGIETNVPHSEQDH